ncbi:MAG: plasmid mobilization relaxosome protein MobC [Lachnospiraceae bacterium]|nr:plasmid mobilization relaxosome protein MobC [Lachnospiraceae bacterium]
MANRTRKNNFYLRLSDDEAFILNEKWKASGMRNRSDFMRHLLIYGYVYNVDYSVVQDNNYQLQKIGTNIMQILKKMNIYGDVYKEDIEEIKELLNKIWLTQVSTQSKLQFKNQ